MVMRMYLQSALHKVVQCIRSHATKNGGSMDILSTPNHLWEPKLPLKSVVLESYPSSISNSCGQVI